MPNNGAIDSAIAPFLYLLAWTSTLRVAVADVLAWLRDGIALQRQQCRCAALASCDRSNTLRNF
ncbi:hypothetical protein [Xanthomonas hortorum]|uniref:Uncharacterized protein n=1 Tax=Xanthomonas hortorum TaxID=56454 RepID=A0AA47IB69_9XANT|nr:hypothetical protein [Xanthomonas hortorum]WAH65716.1 hypothetical protein OEG85_07160 [Xanthomonas hortorum]